MKHPGASGVDIPGLHPHDTGTRRAHPPSSYPDIPTAGPTLVSADPDISWSRRDTNHTYSHGRRWGNTNHCRLRGSDKSPGTELRKEQRECSSFHHLRLLNKFSGDTPSIAEKHLRESLLSELFTVTDEAVEVSVAQTTESSVPTRPGFQSACFRSLLLR